ncbi:MAG: hypothetical protein LAO79_20840 [Acidobacteriia bacterium]|nr:hypothetical protein [Terriglobia bacterium]
MKRHLGIALILSSSPALFAQKPVVADGGVINAASFAKDSKTGLGTATAPGSLVAIFGTFTASTVQSADTIPYSTSLGGVSVTIGGVKAPLQNVILDQATSGGFPFITAQVPFEVLSGQTSGNANVVVTINGVDSDPKPMPFVAASPGLFTIPANGQGNAVLVMTDGPDVGKIAAPNPAAVLNYPAAPIKAGGRGFFYATGLGALSPAVNDGDGGLDGVTHQSTAPPTVLIGGITATVEYAGVSGYPGVYQVNIIVPSGVPTGDKVPLVVKTADGSITSNTATIAIQ